jgi:urease accessory protein UreE
MNYKLDINEQLVLALGEACFKLGDQYNHEPLAVKEQRVIATKNALLSRLRLLQAYEAAYRERCNEG